MDTLKNNPYQTETLHRILENALEGKNSHLSAGKALEALKLDITGRKILNTPYTIWQLLKHMNYWQDKFLARLQGEEVRGDASWIEGWEETLNADNQQELEREIDKLLQGINLAKSLMKEADNPLQDQTYYATKYDVVQSMASHLSYHLAELILLRRIFGAWPPPSGGYVW